MINVSLKNSIIEHIYDAIQNDQFKANEHIKETELAEQLGVSRAPVREALNELVALGILIKYERRGIFLKEATKEDILNTYHTKGLIEGYLACDFILEANDEDYEKLDQLLRQMRMQDKGRIATVGKEFHEHYLKYSTNDILIETLKKVNKKSYILFYRNWSKLYTVSDIVERHKEIVDALKSRDKKRVEQVIRDHYNETGMKIALKITGSI